MGGLEEIQTAELSRACRAFWVRPEEELGGIHAKSKTAPFTSASRQAADQLEDQDQILVDLSAMQERQDAPSCLPHLRAIQGKRSHPNGRGVTRLGLL